MKKFTRILQNYLIFAFPVVLTIIVWGELRSVGEIDSSSSLIIRSLWELGSWMLILWFASLIVFLVTLVAHPPAREETLRRIANLKERDEREEYMTGRAARSSYISTLSVLIFLLFVSIFQVNITHIPENERIDGKTKALNIGIGFELFDEAREVRDASGQILFESRGVPLSTSAVLLVVLLWQLASFNLSIRKLGREP